MKPPFSIYSTWGLQDELGDRVELSEELARHALKHILRWRDEFGIATDFFHLDCFWFDPDKGYRDFKKPHWPNGFEPLRDDILAAGMRPGLWYSVNGWWLKPPQWQASLSADGTRYSLADGPYGDDFHASLLHAAEKWQVRLFKFDFASFHAAPAGCTRPVEETRRRSVERFVEALRDLRAQYPDVHVITHCGFARNSIDGYVGDPAPYGTDPAFLEVADAVFSGDPHAWDLPQTALVRTMDLYQDHQVWKMHREGFPLDRLEDHGVIVGTTNTCHYRGRVGFRRTHLGQLARGGRRDMFYGDPALLTDDDLRHLRAARALFFDAFRRNLTTAPVGGRPGSSPWHGYLTGGGTRGLLYLVNPGPTPVIAHLYVPNLLRARALFHDGLDVPETVVGSEEVVVTLQPEQMALIGLGNYADVRYELGSHDDPPLPVGMRPFPLSFHADGAGLSAACEQTLPPGTCLHVLVQVDDAAPTAFGPARPFRFGNQSTKVSPDMEPKTHKLVEIRAVGADGVACEPLARIPDVPVWSGISWVAATFAPTGPFRIAVVQRLDPPRRLRPTAYTWM